MKLALLYRHFNLFKPVTWSGAAIRAFVYHKGKGQHDKIKWHHNGIWLDQDFYEALHKFEKNPAAEGLSKYDKVAILKPTFEVDESVLKNFLESQLGKKYNYAGTFILQALYQTLRIWWGKEWKRPNCSQIVAKAFYYSAKDRDIANIFRAYDKFDPQDFVRLWKVNKLFDENTK